MAANVQFDLVSPERKLTSVLVEQVQIPGADGDLTAMAGHEPTILSLRPGLLIATGPGVEEQYVVTGGFAELTADNISVLAELALPRGEMSQEVVTDLIKQATIAREEAHPDENHATEKFLADLIHIAEDLGFHTNL